MILYTMMPQELIYPCDESEFGKHSEVVFNGIPLMVEKTEDNQYRVVRVMSTDPAHFLDSRCIPGANISIQ